MARPLYKASAIRTGSKGRAYTLPLDLPKSKRHAFYSTPTFTVAFEVKAHSLQRGVQVRSDPRAVLVRDSLQGVEGAEFWEIRLGTKSLEAWFFGTCAVEMDDWCFLRSDAIITDGQWHNVAVIFQFGSNAKDPKDNDDTDDDEAASYRDGYFEGARCWPIARRDGRGITEFLGRRRVRGGSLPRELACRVSIVVDGKQTNLRLGGLDSEDVDTIEAQFSNGICEFHSWGEMYAGSMGDRWTPGTSVSVRNLQVYPIKKLKTMVATPSRVQSTSSTKGKPKKRLPAKRTLRIQKRVMKRPASKRTK